MMPKGLELIEDQGLSRFEELNGSIDNYDGLMWHPGIIDLSQYQDRVKAYSKNKPVIILSDYSQTISDYSAQFLSLLVFSYRDVDAIAEYFLKKQTPKSSQ
jgi:hypothetical protein